MSYGAAVIKLTKAWILMLAGSDLAAPNASSAEAPPPHWTAEGAMLLALVIFPSWFYLSKAGPALILYY